MTTSEIRLYNTLTRQKEVLRPFDPENVRMYVCGPTVYDFAHIGNARPVIVFDVLFRLLRHVYGENAVTYVRNITDVDDKINARALRDHPGLPLNDAIRLVTEKTAAQFHKDVAALGCLEPSVEPRATDNIDQMVALIQNLIDQGHAYIAKGEEGREVLFDVVSMPDYGGLSKRNLDEQQAGARIAVEAHKKNPADFVLWKESAADLPGWDARFTVDGKTQTIHGRPGWHIECSAMSERHLWAEIEERLSPEAKAHPHQFDIHGGGLDLIFPHHENEIAQSRCAHGTPTMAQIWMHNGFLQVEGQKMSKSLGNFVTIHDVLTIELPALVGSEGQDDFSDLQSRWNGLSARLSMLQTHYREPIDWTQQRLLESSDELYAWYEKLREAHFDASIPLSETDDVALALSDDLNTWQAITLLRKAAKSGNVRLLGDGMALLGLLDDYFLRNDDLLFFDRTAGADTGEVESAINDRLAALNARDFAKADAIRAELLEKGIQLMDFKDPESGERRTKWEIKR